MSQPPNCDTVAEIVRRSLEAGQAVEIEGLGTFRLDPESRHCTFDAQTSPQVFIAYAVEDLAAVRSLAGQLRAAGCLPWIDKEMLLPGQNWPRAIERAIDVADAFIPCFSPRSAAKRGQFQSELRYALECARRRPLDETFLIPVRLEPCTVPSRIVSQVQYVDLFPDWDRGVQRIARAIRKAARGKPVAELA